MPRPIRFVACAALAVFAVGTLAASAHAAADANGTWKWTFTTQGGQEFALSLTLKQEGEKLSGALTTPTGDSIDIKDGSFKNDEVKFQITFERNGNTITTKYQGKVDGDTIKGKTERERDGQTQSRDWEAKREKK